MKSPKVPDWVVLREATRRYGFRGFIANAWHLVDTAVFKPAWHIDAMADHLEALAKRDLKRLYIAVPPRMAKSTCSGPLFHAYMLTLNPIESIMRVSYADQLVIRDSNRTIDLIKSDTFQKAFPHAGKLPNVVAVKDWRTDKGGSLFSTTIRGKATGFGASAALFDDPNKAGDATMGDRTDPAMLRQTTELFSTTFANRISGDVEQHVKAIIMQRIHMMDLIGVAKEMGYEGLTLPFRYDPAVCWDMQSSLKFVDPRTEPGEVLFAPYAGEAGHRLEAEMGNGQARQAQLQQNPTPDSGGFVEKAWLESTFRELPAPPQRATWYQSWDLSARGNLQSHSRCCGILAAVYNNDLYVHSVQLGHWNYPSVKKVFMDLQKDPDWSRAKKIILEAKANAVPLADDLGFCWEAPERGRDPLARKLHLYNPGNVSKEDRLRDVSDIIQAGRIKLKEGEGWRDGFISELVSFPNGVADDQVDALTQLLTVAKLRGGSLSQAANNI